MFLAGIGGGVLGGSFLPGFLNCSREVPLCGNWGMLGGGSTSIVVMEGLDLVPFRGIRNVSLTFSCCGRFGGRGGKLVGS